MSGSWSGGYLRELREAAGLSLQAVADRMREGWGYNVTALEVEDWESDRVVPSANAAGPLQRVLGLREMKELFRPGPSGE